MTVRGRCQDRSTCAQSGVRSKYLSFRGVLGISYEAVGLTLQDPVYQAENPVGIIQILFLRQAGSIMRYYTTFLLLAFSGGISACTGFDLMPAKTPRSYEKLEVSLDRSSCFGRCPSYVVKVSGDGNVSFCGFTDVDKKGRATKRIDPNDVQSLYNKILAADFFNLRDEYFASVTDNPAYTVSVSVDGQTKTVRDYVGREDGMPESVKAIQDSIDEVTGTSEWIGSMPKKHSGPIDVHTPDCEDEFRPGAKAFRKSLNAIMSSDS